MQILVINHSKLVGQNEIASAAKAIDVQLTRDVSPLCWTIPIRCGTRPFQDVFANLHVFDDADQADALGYHDEDPQGNIYGRVFARPCLENDVPISSVISHEAIEIVGDKTVNRWVLAGSGTFYAEELCDPVESQSYGIRVQGEVVPVSNFVLPAWFDSYAKPGSRCDFMRKLSEPFSLDVGGYAIIMDQQGNVQQIFGEKYPEWRKKTKQHPAARTARRLSK